MAQFGTVMGQDGLKWWIGTVEDRGSGQFSGQKDNLKLGRIKVRIKGHHTEDKSKLPTKDLPWCYVMQSTGSAAISGVGSSPTGLVENSKVLGFFMDGDGGQVPIVFGVLPHIQQKEDAAQSAPGSGAKTDAAPPKTPAGAGSAGGAGTGTGPNGSGYPKTLEEAQAYLAKSEQSMKGPQKGETQTLTYNGQQYKITY